MQCRKVFNQLIEMNCMIFWIKFESKWRKKEWSRPMEMCCQTDGRKLFTFLSICGLWTYSDAAVWNCGGIEISRALVTFEWCSCHTTLYGNINNKGLLYILHFFMWAILSEHRGSKCSKFKNERRTIPASEFKVNFKNDESHQCVLFVF